MTILAKSDNINSVANSHNYSIVPLRLFFQNSMTMFKIYHQLPKIQFL